MANHYSFEQIIIPVSLSRKSEQSICIHLQQIHQLQLHYTIGDVSLMYHEIDVIHFSVSASRGSGLFSFAHLRQLSFFKHVQAFSLCFSTQNDCKNSHRSAEALRSLRAPKRGGSRSAGTLQSTSPVQVSKFETHVSMQSWDLAWCLCNGKLGDPIPAIWWVLIMIEIEDHTRIWIHSSRKYHQKPWSPKKTTSSSTSNWIPHEMHPTPGNFAPLTIYRHGSNFG